MTNNKRNRRRSIFENEYKKIGEKEDKETMGATAAMEKSLFVLLALSGLVLGLRYNYGDGSYYIGNVDGHGKPHGNGKYYNTSGSLGKIIERWQKQEHLGFKREVARLCPRKLPAEHDLNYEAIGSFP